VIRSWPSFAAAADEALFARIWSGIHFRFAMLDTRVVAEQIAAYVLEHARSLCTESGSVSCRSRAGLQSKWAAPIGAARDASRVSPSGAVRRIT
jgi:hypothetical protein